MEFAPKGSIGNKPAPKRLQAITRTNADPIH